MMEYKELTEIYTDSDDNSLDSNGNPAISEGRRPSSHRKRINKPLMERKRRARINQSLTQLKTLVLNGMKKDASRHNRLEKADILEMTVYHIQQLHRLPTPTADAGTLEDKYRIGYTECAGEVSRYMEKANDLDDRIKVNVLTHLQRRIHNMIQESPPTPPSTSANTNHNTLMTTPLRKLLPKTEITPLSNANVAILQVKPTVLDLRMDPATRDCPTLSVQTTNIDDLSNKDSAPASVPSSNLSRERKETIVNFSHQIGSARDPDDDSPLDELCTSGSDAECSDNQSEERNVVEPRAPGDADSNHEHLCSGDMWRPW